MEREKIMNGLRCHAGCERGFDCDTCDYIGDGDCSEILARDALALLKEQETKWIHREDLDFKDKLGCNHFHGMCENCGFIHDFIDGHTEQYKYCPQCGRSVKWND